NRHKPDMNLMHDSHEGYDRYLREVQLRLQSRMLSPQLYGKDSASERCPWANID
ncbi:hypothetical protein BGX27_005559, partial [Mortierella sp. AM989]